MLTPPSKKQNSALGQVAIFGVFALIALCSVSTFGTVISDIPGAANLPRDGGTRRTLKLSGNNSRTANTTVIGRNLSPRSGPAIWDGGTGNWFSTPTNWFCIEGGMPVPCGPPDGPQWDVNIGNSGINGTVLLNMPVTVNSVTLGVAGTGTLDVSGSNSLTTNTTIVGNSAPGSGTLNITGGGLVSDTTGYIGALSGSVGSATVTGSGSQWNNSGALYIGDYGQGTLSISGGGAVVSNGSSNGSNVGYQPGSIGVVTVSGVGSKWDDSGIINVGYFSQGNLTVEAGGTVNAAYVQIAYLSGSSGSVTVTGAGSQLNTSKWINVGILGPGLLTIENSGVVNTVGEDEFGIVAPAQVNVTGAGSQLNAAAGFIVTNGIVTIQNRGVVNSDGVVYIGWVSDLTGQVTVSGAGSLLNNPNSIALGNAGSGGLTINDGGVVNTISADFGFRSGSGTGMVAGAGSQLNSSGPIRIGNGGQGMLTIQDGGVVNGQDGVVGAAAGGIGTVIVTGGGSEWTNANSLYVGYRAPGLLTVNNGGTVTAQTLTIGTLGRL